MLAANCWSRRGRWGVAPLRSEVEEPSPKKLIARCGSWRNTLYQIGLEPVAHITPFSGTVLSNTNKGTKRHRTVLHECYYKVLNLDERAKRGAGEDGAAAGGEAGAASQAKGGA
ncbi:MAG: hypothetical protein ACLSAF_21955 [Intestinimonas sp.]